MRESTFLLRLLKPHWKGMAGAAFFSALTVASNVGLLGVSALLISVLRCILMYGS